MQYETDAEAPCRIKRINVNCDLTVLTLGGTRGCLDLH